MLSAIFNVLPDWAVATIIAALAWFGVNYIWLGPTYFERTIEGVMTRSSYKTGCTSTSHFLSGYGSVRYDMAMYTATFGYHGYPGPIMRQACASVQ